MYQYDADNRRVSLMRGAAPSLVTHFVLDGQHEIEERDGAGALRYQYVFGPRVDEVILRDDNLLVEELEGVPSQGSDPVFGLATLIAECADPSALNPLLPDASCPAVRRLYYRLDDKMSAVTVTNGGLRVWL